MSNGLEKFAGLLGLGAGAAGVATAYEDLRGIGAQAKTEAETLAGQILPMSQFRPFTVTSATGGQFGVTPQLDAQGNVIGTQAFLGVSPAEQALQQNLLGQAQTQLASGVTGLPSLESAGLALLGRGRTQLEQTPFGLLNQQLTSQRASDLGGMFMGAAGAQPADINLLRGQFAGQVGGLLGQQPSPAIGQFGQQALSMGQAGLGAQAPADVEALRRQYTQLASQTASRSLQDTAGREADVYERIRATQRPEEERQRLALEERMAQQGRLGVRTAMYGGTPEQAALAMQQEEAQNRASLAAIQQAQAERQQAVSEAQTFGGLFGQQAGLSSQLQSAAQQRAAQLSQLGLSAQQIESQLQSEGLGRATTAAGQAAQLAQVAGGLQAQQGALGAQFAGLGGQLAAQEQALRDAQQQRAIQSLISGQGMLSGGLGLQQAQQQLGLSALGGAYVPQAQMLNVQQAAQLYPQMQQQAQLFGVGQLGETRMTGIEAQLIAEQARANLIGGLGTGLLGGLFNPIGNAEDGFTTGLIELLGGG